MNKFNQALSYSFLLLRYRDRSSLEVIQRLKKKKYSAAVIKQTIQYLKENRYINDQRFVNNFTASAIEKGWGPRKIDFRLKALGIGSNLRRQVKFLEFDFKGKLQEIIEGKVDYLKKQKPPLPAKKICQKVMRFSLGRGFSQEDVWQELNNLEVGRLEDS